jgi:dynein heavy chain
MPVARHPLVKMRSTKPRAAMQMTIPIGGSFDGELGSLISEAGSLATAGNSFLSNLALTPAQMANFIDDPGNFLYLSTRAGSGGMAYDLSVVEHADIDPEDYYTLSCSGLTHFMGNASDFTPLERWEREYSLFNKMRSIGFFARYRKWKNFVWWKQTVKKTKIGKAGQKLSETFFIFLPPLNRALLQIRRKCCDIGMLRLLDVETGKTYSLQSFIEYQSVIQENLTVKLSEFSHEIHNTVRNACDGIVDEFLQANKIQADHKMTFMERASLRSECRKLTRFLRLTDFMVIDMLRDLAQESVEHALALVKPCYPMPQVIFTEQVKEKEEDVIQAIEDLGEKVDDGTGYTPLFSVAANYTQKDGMLIAPPAQDFKEAFKEIIVQSLKVISIPERVLSHEELAAYIMVENSEGDDVAQEDTPVVDLVSTDEKFEATAQEIYIALDKAMGVVESYVEVFDPYLTTFNENSEFVDNVHERYKAVDLDFYRSELKKYGGMATTFNEIPATAKVDIFSVDSWSLKVLLIPSPLLCIEVLKNLLPTLIGEHATSLDADISEILPIIRKPTKDTEAYILRKKTVELAIQSMDTYKERKELIDKMVLLVAENGWVLLDDIKHHVNMIVQNIHALDNGLASFESTCEDDLAKCIADVTAEVPILTKKMNDLRGELEVNLVADTEQSPDNVLAFLEHKEETMIAQKKRSELLQDFQATLGQDISEYEILEEVQADLNIKLKLWRAVKEWDSVVGEWETTELKAIDQGALEKKVMVMKKTCNQASKTLLSNPVGPALNAKVAKWLPVLPCITDLRNEALKDRHWEDINNLVGFNVQEDITFTVGDLIGKEVTKHQDEISNIATTAVQERVLEEMMSKVTGMWIDAELDCAPYKEEQVKDLYILGDVSEIITNLDESLVTINTVLGSRFVGGIRDFVEKWRHDLMLFQETLDEWLALQRSWIYLETIFSSADIVRQLPAAAKQFQAVDKSWRHLMKVTAEEPAAVKSGTIHGRKELFQSHNHTLDKVAKSLEEYLETKRARFPRFYFLSNEDLLDILSKSKDPLAVLPHLPKCYEALNKFEFANGIDIIAIKDGNKQPERIELKKQCKARGNVEDWLANAENVVKNVLHGLLKTGLLDYPNHLRHEWLKLHPGQVVATVAQMTWAAQTEESIVKEQTTPGAMNNWLEEYKEYLVQLVTLINSPLKSLERKVIIALVTTDVHAKDIIDILNKDKIHDVAAFTWQMQLRYYWEPAPTDDCIIKHSDARIKYGYEYMGATSRLVITPLTDMCWMTLTASYGLKLGGAPAGPAGTGKTESSKDLAKAMAIFCLVFNCSDQITVAQMGTLFRGLAQAGVWTCLDEFNRIDIEVLSVIAQQMQQLKEGRIMGKSTINFMGVDIILNDHHVIITMNPGYAGRTELPDNLQVCFRPVSMMVPNYALIAEIMLYAEGFVKAGFLARKMCKLYILCSEQLSQQPHYDYGLRAVKSVLNMAGGLLRNNRDLPEDLVLIRALRDANQPKFLAQDIPLFRAIILDLFPGAEIPPNDYGEFGTVMHEQLEEQNLQSVDAFEGKIVQMFDIFQIRFGATLVGPTGSGKSTIWRVLAQTMSKLRQSGSNDERYAEVIFSILNPKCITMGELYGEMNTLTQEWHDGLASTIMRGYVPSTYDKNGIAQFRWTVFDGPIDALWIENMNTVLDDNMTLCLANGERIKLNFEMKCLFEVNDLAVASPATVSRIGVVYVSPTDLNWWPTMQTWVATKLPKDTPQSVRDYILGLVEKYMDAGIKWQRKFCKEYIATVNVGLTGAFSFLFQSMFLPEKKIVFDQDEGYLCKIAAKIFAFAFTWAIGGTITAAKLEAFDEFVRSLFDEGGLDCGMPPMLTVFDYFVDLEANEFKRWESIVPEFKYSTDLPFFSLFVPTIDTVRFSTIMTLMIEQQRAVFLTGDSGTGKTAIITQLLQKLEPTSAEGGLGVNALFISYSAQTSSLVTQCTIEGKMERKKKTLLGAPVNRKVVIFIDDVNMPLVETYGAQAPVELMRQFLDHNSFFDRDKLFQKWFQDTMCFTAAAPPGGGRSPVTPRFTRHFNVLCVPPAADASKALIFSSILKGFLVKGYLEDVKKMVGGIVQGTIDVYNRISAELLPTPARFHYLFNLRDISKVFQGLLMVSYRKVNTVDSFARLWIHEISRVFYDRLVNVEDQQWFEALVGELQGKSVGTSFDADEIFNEKPIMFVEFLKPGMEPEDRFYEEAKDVVQLRKLLDDSLFDYNSEFPTQMNLVFFTDAIKHVVRVSRLLRQPRGNAMLIGVGGSGRQSTTRMAAFVGGMDLVGVVIVRGYGLNEFREDMKQFMISAGVEGKPTVFLFTESQIVLEDMLEDINNMLNSGEIPNLYPQDELDKIVGDMFPICKELGIPETRDSCLTTFVRRSRENLHIVLAMSPVGDALRIRCRNFNALINCCTVDWFMKWPEEALVSVAQRYLGDLELPDEDVCAGIVKMCSVVHTSVQEQGDVMMAELRRRTYVTPKSYLDLIGLYLAELGGKQSDVQTKQDQMIVGVTKLNETNAVVDGLRDDLKALAPVLVEKSAAAEKMLAQVAIDSAEADAQKEVVEAEVAIVSKQAADVQVVADDAQKDLDLAMPALSNAVKALDSLKPGDLNEMKGFAKPPPLVMVTMEAVSILLGEKLGKDELKNWKQSQGILQRGSKLLDELKGYDKDNIPQDYLKKLQPFLEREDFTPDAVGKQSLAAKGMCMWVRAMDVYSRVAKEVEPKKQKLAKLKADLKVVQDGLVVKQSALQEVLDKVAELQRLCQETMDEKDRLQKESDQTAIRLTNAERLTSGLAEEGVRWKETVEILGKAKVDLIGDVFMSCAAISYYGPFPGNYRTKLVETWSSGCSKTSVPASEKYSLANTMGNPVTIKDWQNQGLPTDEVSTNSAILVVTGKRWPLMIDPQGQANKWLKNLEEKNDMQMTKMNDINLLRTLESCIRVGKPLMLEDIGETLEPALEPVLQRATFKEGNRILITLGDTNVDYDPNFKLYMTTKLPNPHYLPEICIKVTIVNFTVTMPGLEDQLLGAVVSKERPDVEERKVRLMLQMAADAKKLHEIEADILHRLSTATGNILDDVDLIDTLANSKITSNMIKDRVVEAEKTEIEINTARESYRDAATRGSIIYFVIADLGSIDPMYQYSLEFYANLFNRCIDDSEASSDVSQRVQTIIDYATVTIYANVCRGLFERHKILFSSLLCFMILKQRGEITGDEWSLAIRGPGAMERNNMPPNPRPEIIPDQIWDLIYAAETRVGFADGSLPFAKLCGSIANQWDRWKKWIDSEDPVRTPVPAPYDESITKFSKLILLRCFRDEQLIFALQDYVAEKMGKTMAESPAATMADVYKDLDNKTPCILILSKGADPTQILVRFARQLGFGDRLQFISLGQGMGPVAVGLIDRGTKTGDWVLLQNCMLAKSWMPALEDICFDLVKNSGDNHEAFRLFLTSMPAPYFPVSVLQGGVKMTNEPPNGVRNNVLRSIASLVSPEYYESCESQPVLWKKLISGLVFFHANVQERRKFGPLGWNILYGFDESDLETTFKIMKRFLDEQETFPWDAMRYVTAVINYGGRVTDKQDKYCIECILSKFIHEDIIKDEYKFSESGTYFAPTAGSHEDMLAYFKILPDSDDPEIFGMHSNANITYNRNVSTDVMTNILELQPRASGGSSAKSSDEIVIDICAQYAEQVPRQLTDDEAGETTFVLQPNGLFLSLAIVLQQEMVKFNRLSGVMGRSLQDLQKAIRGEIVMSNDLDAMYTACLNNQLPPIWTKVSFATLKSLASWMKDVNFRVNFMRVWLQEGLPTVFPLPVFFFPQGFMTGCLQTYARKYQVAIDTLNFMFEILEKEPEELTEHPEDGVFCYGIYFEGARWDRAKRLIQPSKPTVMYEELPPIHFQPAVEHVCAKTDFACPLYKTTERKGVLSTTGMSTNYVVSIDMPTDIDPQIWTRAGCASLCNLTD